MKTIDSLGIYWSFESASGKYQEEVPGLIFYGFWVKKFDKEELCKAGNFIDFWVDDNVEMKTVFWDGAGNANISVEVKINAWPENWMAAIENALRWFLERGASVAWCGTENSSPSLQSFSPINSSGGIYAACSDESGLKCNADLYDEYEELEDKDLVVFARATGKI